jgi:O-antigen/teichoic acid export membrane protein
MSRDALVLFVARVISAFSTVAVLAIVARLGDPVALGIVALGLTIGLALAVFSEAGLTALLIREVARDPDRSGTVLTAILLTRAVALPAVLLIAGLFLANTYPADAALILLVALGPAIQQVGELARSVFIARKRIPVASAHSIVENVAWLSAIAIGVSTGSDLAMSFTAAAAAVVLIDIGAFVLLRAVLGVRL